MMILAFFLFGTLLGIYLKRSFDVAEFYRDLLNEEFVWRLEHSEFVKEPTFRRHDALFPLYDKLVLKFWEPLDNYHSPVYNYYKDTPKGAVNS